MSENAIFLVGIIIFAITVYGTVMAGGLALTKVAVDQSPALGDDSYSPAAASEAVADVG
ncbi:MAG: hypothetical protein ACSLFP_18745 [Acidimicrobiales bacterium]